MIVCIRGEIAVAVLLFYYLCLSLVVSQVFFLRESFTTGKFYMKTSLLLVFFLCRCKVAVILC